MSDISEEVQNLSVNETTNEVVNEPPKPAAKFAKFGGGGQSCFVCSKTAFPAETVQFEQKPYHIDCFFCIKCKKKLEQFQAAKFEEQIYCKSCFSRDGLNRKQAEVKWDSTKAVAQSPSSSSLFGGGGAPCTVCSKTVYPAETFQFEQKPYHQDCFLCMTCGTRILQAAQAATFEEKLMCKSCFQKDGYHLKQREVNWDSSKAGTLKENPLASKFGGGGSKCGTCDKTVYAGEAVQYDGVLYHPKCLACSTCSKETVLSDTNKFDGKLLCGACWKVGKYAEKQLDMARKPAGDEKKANSVASKFGGGGQKCHVCATTVYPAETLQYEGRPYHVQCFKCSHCAKGIQQPAHAEYKEDKVYCKKCFQDLGLWKATINPHTSSQ